MGAQLITRRASRLLTALLIGPVLVAATAVAPQAAQATGGSSLVAAANSYRTAQGKPQVALHATVDRIAVERGGHMARNDDFRHDFAYIERRLKELGMCWRGYGEIIAYESGQATQSSSRTMGQWWNSGPHRAIMLGDYNVAGGHYQVSTATGRRYSVMVFVKTCAPVSTTAAWGAKVTYNPPRRVNFAAGTYIGFKFNSAGAVTARKSYTLTKPSGASTSARQYINGRAYFYITNGVWAGYWILDTQSVGLG